MSHTGLVVIGGSKWVLEILYGLCGYVVLDGLWCFFLVVPGVFVCLSSL